MVLMFYLVLSTFFSTLSKNIDWDSHVIGWATELTSNTTIDPYVVVSLRYQCSRSHRLTDAFFYADISTSSSFYLFIFFSVLCQT